MKGKTRTTLLLMSAILGISIPAVADEFTGRASVIDGDTIEIQGQRIRFDGIDAPESRQQCKDAQGETIGAVRRLRTLWTPSWQILARRAAPQAAKATIASLVRAGGLTGRTSTDGWLHKASPLIGRNTATANTRRSNGRPNRRSEVCGPAPSKDHARRVVPPASDHPETVS